MKNCFFTVLAIMFLLSGCGSASAEKPSDIEETPSNIHMFTCSICGRESAVCDCHIDLGYPDDVCCECSKLNYEICEICGYAYPSEDIHSDNGLLFCESCAKEHGEDNPVYINGEPFYFEVATPAISGAQ